MPRLYSAFLGSNRTTTSGSFAWGPDQLRLLFTDTDSLAYAVQTEDIYRDMAGDAATHYDYSEYPLDHPLYSARQSDPSRTN